MKGYEPLLTARIKQLIEKLGNQSGDIDLALFLSYLSYDFMGDML